MEPLSAVVLTLNEERNIGRCIESLLPVVDEIVVIDSFSSDQTEAICKQYPQVKFIRHRFEGHIEQKNYGLAQASNNLVLSLDADEALSDLLARSILKVRQHRQAEGYSMNRFTSYCGQWIRHSGWYPDRKIRLFDRSKGKWGGVNPHDRVEMHRASSTQHLEGDILHYSYYSHQELKLQTLKFAKIGALALYKNGKGRSWIKILWSPPARFFRAFFIKLGFLDGRAGLIIAWYSAKECFLKYKGLRQLMKEEQNDTSPHGQS